jgi:hypothetical protein
MSDSSAIKYYCTKREMEKMTDRQEEKERGEQPREKV